MVANSGDEKFALFATLFFRGAGQDWSEVQGRNEVQAGIRFRTGKRFRTAVRH
jgi:hypothetical protein